MRGIIIRRFKWAFKIEYEDYENPPIAHPHLESYLTDVHELDDDEWFSPSDSFKFAQDLLEGLLKERNAGGWAEHWKDERLQGLVLTCRELGHLPRRSRFTEGEQDEQPKFDIQTLKWETRTAASPWFPSLPKE
ncbi:N-alpha-acetyltransferase, non-catalitic subunit [Paramarasmius palmivorus]|uniref:N-alpha-acetyltransferase, non-catalitic subunit n=1 Tax=Paramarasmius palmivorus TaxID=297713 RepID=A0AAW0CNB8_9AGAR